MNKERKVGEAFEKLTAAIEMAFNPDSDVTHDYKIQTN